MLRGNGGDLEGVGKIADRPAYGRTKFPCRRGIDAPGRAHQGHDVQASLHRGTRQSEADMTRRSGHEQCHGRSPCESGPQPDRPGILQELQRAIRHPSSVAPRRPVRPGRRERAACCPPIFIGSTLRSQSQWCQQVCATIYDCTRPCTTGCRAAPVRPWHQGVTAAPQMSPRQPYTGSRRRQSR